MKSDTLSQTLTQLVKWYELHQRILPWRDRPELYPVWISEVMLQQTQVATVLPYFERFMSRFPSVNVLASAPTEDVLAAWAGLGYYSRARNLHKAAKQIVANGFPQTREGWLEIPGVGPYASGAIASIALNHPEPILDGNVERVVSRLECVGREMPGGVQVTQADYKVKLWERSTVWVKTGFAVGLQPRDLNQAIMELGAKVCIPRSPKCGECPVSRSCQAFHLDVVEQYPAPRAKKEWTRVVEERIAFFRADGAVLLRRNSSDEWSAGLFDLPLRSEFVSAVELRGASPKPDLTIKHVVTHHKIERKTFKLNSRVKSAAGLLKRVDGSEQETTWVSSSADGIRAGLSSASRKTLSRLFGPSL